MTPRIVNIDDKKLIGLRLTMSVSENKTGELWSKFMPRRFEIQNAISSELFSLQVYDKEYFVDFDPHRSFEKWAAMEVSDSVLVPDGMESMLLSGGTYAVFDYKGSSSDTQIFQYIYSTWLPQSGYQLGDRPHFEVLGEKYKNNSPDSEEEIWIPLSK